MSSISKLHTSVDEVVSVSSGSSTEKKKCPFLAEVQIKDKVVTEASSETQEDVIKLKDERSKLFLFNTERSFFQFIVPWNRMLYVFQIAQH